MRKALFIVAHPDDAELAAGGTIRQLCMDGVHVKVLNLTISELTPKTKEARVQAAQRASEILGYELLFYKEGIYNHVVNIPNNKLVQYIDNLVMDWQPDAVFSHWENDSHMDHIFTAKAVIASSRRWNAALYAFPPNELKTTAFQRFVPNTFVDISLHIREKLKAIKQYTYAGQKFKQLMTQDFETINRSMGIQANCEFAEAFILIRQTGIFTLNTKRLEKRNASLVNVKKINGNNF